MPKLITMPDVIKSSPSKEGNVLRQLSRAEEEGQDWSQQNEHPDSSIWFFQPELMGSSQGSPSIDSSSSKQPQPSSYVVTNGDDDQRSMSTSAPPFSSFPSQAPSTSPKNRSRYKTELCRPFQDQGRCHYGEKCQFAHGNAELRTVPRHPKYKTELCKTFHSAGLCPYGPRCHFIHSLDELITLKRNQNIHLNRSPGFSAPRPLGVRDSSETANSAPAGSGYSPFRGWQNFDAVIAASRSSDSSRSSSASSQSF